MNQNSQNAHDTHALAACYIPKPKKFQKRQQEFNDSARKKRQKIAQVEENSDDNEPLQFHKRPVKSSQEQRRVDLRKALNLPETAPKNILPIKESDKLRQKINGIPQMKDNVVSTALLALNLHDQENRQLRVSALEDKNPELKRTTLRYLWGEKLTMAEKSEEENKNLLAKFRNHLPKTAKHAPTQNQFALPDHVRTQRNRQIFQMTLHGKQQSAPQRDEPIPTSMEDVNYRKHFLDNGFTGPKEFAQSREAEDKYRDYSQNRKLLKPHRHTDAKAQENKFLKQSYAQRANGHINPSIELMFNGLYQQEKQITEKALQKLAHFKTPAEPCNPFVTSVATLLPHIYESWKHLTINSMEYSSTLTGDAQDRHREKLNKDKEINNYFLDLIQRILAQLRPGQLTFDKTWTMLKQSQELENNFPWRGNTQEIFLQKKRQQMGLELKTTLEKKADTERRILHFYKAQLSKTDQGAIQLNSKSFFSKTGFAHKTVKPDQTQNPEDPR